MVQKCPKMGQKCSKWGKNAQKWAKNAPKLPIFAPKKLETLLKEARCRLDSAGAARLILGGRARTARHTRPVRQTNS